MARVYSNSVTIRSFKVRTSRARAVITSPLSVILPEFSIGNRVKLAVASGSREVTAVQNTKTPFFDWGTDFEITHSPKESPFWVEGLCSQVSKAGTVNRPPAALVHLVARGYGTPIKENRVWKGESDNSSRK